jgi:hypothetical protein
VYIQFLSLAGHVLKLFEHLGALQLPSSGKMRQEEIDVFQYIGLLVTMVGVRSVVIFYIQVFFDFCNNHITNNSHKGRDHINQTFSFTPHKPTQ